MARTHTIRGAFAFMEDGEKVAREKWLKDGWYIQMNFARNHITNEDEETWEPTHNDIVAQDWVMVD